MATRANQIPCPTNEPKPSGVPPFDTQSENTTRTVNGSPSDLEVNNMADEERNGLEIASAALGELGSVGEVPFYAGKKPTLHTMREGEKNHGE